MARPPQITRIVDSSKWVNLLVYGNPGAGKTPLAGTSPKALILEADDGEASAAVWGTDAEMWKVRDWNELDEAYEWVRQEGHKEFEWVWLDSGTLFQERGLDHIMEDLVADKPHRSKYLPDRGEYRENMSRFKEKIRYFKALPVNFGLTAHVMKVEDSETGETQYVPSFQGQGVWEKVTSYFDIVGFLDLLNTGREEDLGRRVLRLENYPRYVLRDRYHCTEKGALVDPTIPKLMSLVAKKKAAGAVKASGSSKQVARPVAKKAPGTVKAPAKKG